MNQGRFVEETILSVRDQDYPRVEHLVIDGGSTDGTIEILKRYAHVIWVSEPDRGQADAVNKGIRRSNGDLLGWLNSDDTYTPGTIRRAVDHFLRHPEVDLVYGDCHVIDDGGRLLEIHRSRPFDYGRLLNQRMTIPQPTVFFRKRVVETVGMLEPDLALAMDFDFWVRVGRRGKIAYLPGLVARFRSYPEAKSTARARDFHNEILFTLNQLFSDPTLPEDLRRRRAEVFGAAYVAAGIRCYHSGERDEAREFFRRGLRHASHPFSPGTLKARLFLLDTLLGTALARHLRSLFARWRP